MTPEQFCYWLQGYFELKKTIDHREGATPETMKVIEDHLQLVFKKETPDYTISRPWSPTHPGFTMPLITC